MRSGRGQFGGRRQATPRQTLRHRTGQRHYGIPLISYYVDSPECDRGNTTLGNDPSNAPVLRGFPALHRTAMQSAILVEARAEEIPGFSLPEENPGISVVVELGFVDVTGAAPPSTRQYGIPEITAILLKTIWLCLKFESF
jgi:hypothetical protein